MLEMIESEGDHWYGIITGQEKPINKQTKKKDKHKRQFYKTYYKEHKKKKYATWQLHRSCRVFQC